jgi:uncharacterized membrane protein
VSCQGSEVHFSGFEAAIGVEKSDIDLDPAPMLFIIPGIAIIVLLMLSIPSLRNNLENKDSPIKIISFAGIIAVIGGVIGILMHIIANNAAMAKVQSEGQGMVQYQTGIGFKICVIAFVIMLVMPFVDKIIPKKSE